MNANIVRPRWHLMIAARVQRPLINARLTRPIFRKEYCVGSRIASGNRTEGPPDTPSLPGCDPAPPSQPLAANTSANIDQLNDSSAELLDETKRQAFGNDFLMGNAYLMIVAVLWGSYSPALRGIFTLPGAPSPLIVAAARGVLQALFLGGAILISSLLTNKKDTDASLPSQEALISTNISKPQPQGLNQVQSAWLGLSPVVAGAIEIGLYNTTGTLLQTWSLSLTSATRSAFLIQATAVWTPLLASAFGMAPSPLLWVSSFIALISTLLVTFDTMDLAAMAAGGFDLQAFLSGASLGDATTLGAALAYSLSTVRIPIYAQRVRPLDLAFGKSVALAVTTSTALALGVAATASSGPEGPAAALSALWPACCAQPVAWGIIVWSAVGPGALSAYLHVKGQSLVSPTDAQVVFATVPLWSALIAAAFLPGEVVGPMAWAGGAGMLLAGLVAALDKAGGEEQRIKKAE